MAEYIIQEETLISLADAVRAKSESTGELSPAQLIEKINALSIGIDTSDATAAAGDILSGKTAYVAGSKVTGTIATKTSSNLTTSGRTVTVPAGYYASNATKSISTATQATPSITVDNDGLITASATQTAGYVSAGTKSATKQLDVKTSTDLTVSGATVTVPAGYYTANATKSVSTATQATPSITVSDAGLITASATQSAGYVSSGTKSATKQLTTKAAATITPSTTEQTIAAGTYLTGTQTIAAIPSSYVKPTATQAAKTWTPTTSTQEIAAGTYLTGKQTIGAIPSNYITTSDATAAASEILSGETAYVNGSKVTGTMTNNGAVSKTLNTSTKSYTVPAGYHSGTGKVSITTETKTATPSTSSQSITPSSGKVLSKVTVNAIPSNYITTSDATAAAGDILSGKTAYVDGEKITGTIATKTSSNLTASGATVSVPAGYYASAASKSVSTATQATPSITVSSSGLITASATQNEGYVSAGTKSATKQLDTETWVITYSNGSSTETVVVL